MNVLGAKYLSIPIHRHPEGGWILYQTVFGFYLPGRFLTLSEIMLAMENARKAALRVSQPQPLLSGAVKPEVDTEKEVQLVAVDRHVVLPFRLLLKIILDIAIGTAIIGFLAFINLVSKGWTP